MSPSMKIPIAFLLLFPLGKTAAMKNPYCQLNCPYRDISLVNTVCLQYPCGIEKGTCGNDSYMIPLSNVEAGHLEHTLNSLRSHIVNIFGAYDMQKLFYSHELQFSAQCWANKCTSLHDLCRKTPNYDDPHQMIVFYPRSIKSSRARIRWTVLRVFAELQRLKQKGFLQKYRSPFTFHEWAQLVWAKTKYFGCGRVYTQKRFLFVCNFWPRGCVRGEPVFEEIGNRTEICNITRDENLTATFFKRELPPWDGDEIGREEKSGALVSGNYSLSNRTKEPWEIHLENIAKNYKEKINEDKLCAEHTYVKFDRPFEYGYKEYNVDPLFGSGCDPLGNILEDGPLGSLGFNTFFVALLLLT